MPEKEAPYGRRLDGSAIPARKGSTRPLLCDPVVWQWLGPTRREQLKKHLKDKGIYEEAGGPSEEDSFQQALKEIDKEAHAKKAAVAKTYSREEACDTYTALAAGLSTIEGTANGQIKELEGEDSPPALEDEFPSFIEYACCEQSQLRQACNKRGIPYLGITKEHYDYETPEGSRKIDDELGRRGKSNILISLPCTDYCPWHRVNASRYGNAYRMWIKKKGEGSRQDEICHRLWTAQTKFFHKEDQSRSSGRGTATVGRSHC